MRVELRPTEYKGEMEILSSKSDGHRLMICAALSDKKTEMKIKNQSEDIQATRECMEALGAVFEETSEGFIIHPIKKVPQGVEIHPKESGSTLRFLLPVTAALTEKATFTGEGRLPDRPLVDLQEEMKAKGVAFSQDKLPFETRGKMKGGHFSLPGNISSQYISGILLAAPLLKEDVVIEVEGKLESRPYIDMTLDSMRRFGVQVEWKDNTFRILNKGYTSPGRVEVEGDYSNGAFFLVAGALSGPVQVKGLKDKTYQGDEKVLSILKDMGASLRKEEGIIVEKGKTQPLRVDLSEIPDLLPILAVLATSIPGESVFYKGERLKYKETNRLETTAQMIRDLGGQVEVTEDGLIIKGSKLSGGRTSSYGDHRIAMAAAIGSVLCEDRVVIEKAQAVNKSYPNFFEDLEKIGGSANVIHLR